MQSNKYTDVNLYYKMYKDCCGIAIFGPKCCQSPSVYKDAKKVEYCC